MHQPRIALVLAAASLAACERSGQPPPQTGSKVAEIERHAGVARSTSGIASRTTDSGLAVDAPRDGLVLAGGDGIRPVPGPSGIRP